MNGDELVCKAVSRSLPNAGNLETALVVVTHNPVLAARADRTLLLRDGRLEPLESTKVVP